MRNKLKKHSVTKNCSDLSLFEQIVQVVSKFLQILSNFKSFSRSLEQFFLTVGQNNFGNKITFEAFFYNIFMGKTNKKPTSRNFNTLLNSKIILFEIPCTPVKKFNNWFLKNVWVNFSMILKHGISLVSFVELTLFAHC